MRMLLLFAIGAALLAESSQPQRIPDLYKAQMQALQVQAEVLRLKVCSEAGIPHQVCIVNWDADVVIRKPEPKQEPKQNEKPAAK